MASTGSATEKTRMIQIGFDKLSHRESTSSTKKKNITINPLITVAELVEARSPMSYFIKNKK
jgi:hypothetical protein